MKIKKFFTNQDIALGFLLGTLCSSIVVNLLWIIMR